jgi:DNA processing protein
MDRDRRIRLGLVGTRGIGPKTARAVRDRCGGWSRAVQAASRGDRAVPERLRPGFANAERRGKEVQSACDACRVRPLFRGEADWPDRVEDLSDPPEVLFLRGRPETLRERAVAVVGTRECSPGGARLARHLGERLAEEGWATISGLARGIDTAAHRGALEADGDTVAVLGCGPDVAYPPENRDLQDRIGEEGAVVSEFVPGAEPRSGHFPRRNRILAALGDAIVVVESRIRGGALVTVRHGLDLGREIFVVPGWPGSARSAGPLALLREGARPIRDAEDLLEDLNGIRGGPGLEPDEVRALEAHRSGARTPDELAAALGVSTPDARDRLARLELLGLVDTREASHAG